jgi:hypothetical protein
LQGLFGGHLLGRGAEGLGSGEDVEPEVAALGFLLSLFNLYLRRRDNRARLRIEKS